MLERHFAIAGATLLALVAAFWMGYMIGISHVTRADADWCIKAAQETNLCEAVTVESVVQIPQ